jgi:hypothetical protein
VVQGCTQLPEADGHQLDIAVAQAVSVEATVDAGDMSLARAMLNARDQSVPCGRYASDSPLAMRFIPLDWLRPARHPDGAGSTLPNRKR